MNTPFDVVARPRFSVSLRFCVWISEVENLRYPSHEAQNYRELHMAEDQFCTIGSESSSETQNCRLNIQESLLTCMIISQV